MRDRLHNLTLAAVLAAAAMAGCRSNPPVGDPAPPVPVAASDDRSGHCDKALLIAINAYPAPNELFGCRNDIDDAEKFLLQGKWFKTWQIVRLVDADATAENIRAALKWLAADYRPGDRRYLHFSGHGAQMEGASEKDGLFEVVCPVDFDWSLGHAVKDIDFVNAFKGFPTGASVFWVSDSCHSGGLASTSRSEIANCQLPIANSVEVGRFVKARRINPPAEIAARIAARVARGEVVRSIRAEGLNVAFLSGCSSKGTSSDAQFGPQNRPNGAFTYYYLKRLQKNAAVDFAGLDWRLDEDLRASGFDQRPAADGLSKHRLFLR